MIFPSSRILGLLLQSASTHVPTSTLSAPGSVNLWLAIAGVVDVLVAGVGVANGTVAVVVVSVAVLGIVAVAVGMFAGDAAICAGVSVIAVVVVVTVGCVERLAGMPDKCLCAEQYWKYPPPFLLAVALSVQPTAAH